MKILFLLLLTVAYANTSSASEYHQYFLLRRGKQILKQDSIQSKAHLTGLQSDLVLPYLGRLQISFDMSPNVTNDTSLGIESLQWNRGTVGKPFTKDFKSSSIDFTLRARLTNYRSNLPTIVDGVETEITNLDIVNCGIAVAELGYEKRIATDWLRIYYNYGLSVLRKSPTKVWEHQAGAHYFLPLFSTASHFSVLINAFAEFDSFKFRKPSESDETIDSELRGSTVFVGVGLGFSF